MLLSSHTRFCFIARLSNGKIHVADRGPAKLSLPKMLHQSRSGAIVNPTNYDRIGEGDTISTE
jgi:hypothetical protein